MMCFANARLILRSSEQPQPLRTLQRSDRQQRPQRPADRIRCRPFRRRHGLLAIPVAGMRKETASRPAAARVGAVAPIGEEIALRLCHIGVALRVGQHAPLLPGHPQRKPPIPRRHLSPHRLLLRSAHCVPRLAMGAPLSAFLSPLRPSAGEGAGRTNERRGQACRHARPRSSFARTRNAQAEREKGNRSRGASSAPEACSPRRHKAKRLRSIASREKREAERRKAHCLINVRVKRGCALLSWRRAAFRRSRLRHSPSTPMAHLQNRVSRGLTDGCFARFAKLPRLSTLRAERSLCRSTGDPKPPGAAISA
jgi:hypothetical protein